MAKDILTKRSYLVYHTKHAGHRLKREDYLLRIFLLWNVALVMVRPCYLFLFLPFSKFLLNQELFHSLELSLWSYFLICWQVYKPFSLSLLQSYIVPRQSRSGTDFRTQINSRG